MRAVVWPCKPMDPLDDIDDTNTIWHVMKNAELREGDTFDEVWPFQKPLAPLSWRNGYPEVYEPRTTI